MTRIALATLLALAACTKPATPPPAVEVRFQEVVRETLRPCPVTIPKRPGKLVKPLPTDAVALAAVLTLKLADYAGPGGYADRAEAALKRCVSE